jgi:hypothetical protein
MPSLTSLCSRMPGREREAEEGRGEAGERGGHVGRHVRAADAVGAARRERTGRTLAGAYRAAWGSCCRLAR